VCLELGGGFLLCVGGLVVFIVIRVFCDLGFFCDWLYVDLVFFWGGCGLCVGDLLCGCACCWGLLCSLGLGFVVFCWVV